MKRYRIYFFLIAALTMTSLTMTSCLDEHPKDQLDEEATCRGIYDYNTLTTDEAMIPIRGGDWYDGGLWNAMYRHDWTADDEPLYDTWKYLYKVIVLANKVLPAGS